MATHIYCDHPNHDGVDDKFTPAVAAVRVSKKDEKTSTVIHTTKNYDACADHIGHFAQIAYGNNQRDPLFYHVVIDKISSDD